MKRKIRNMTLGAILIAAFSMFTSMAAESLLYDAQQALAHFISTDSTLKPLLNSSAGYAVFPGVGKGGFIVGGARGRGLVFARGNVIGEATMTQASIGAQAGGQSFNELIIFQTPAALNDFKSGNFEMRAEVSAVVAGEGASRTARFVNGVAVFTMPLKGLMVQASVGGQKFRFTPTTTPQ